MAKGPYLRKYGAATTVLFDLFEVDGIDFRVDAVHATGDTTIMKDEGAETNTTNGFVDEGNGYSIALTATEMQAARIKVYIIDQTATKVWLDTSITVETYGNASAQHAMDLDEANGTQFTEAGGTGDHLTAINLPNQTMDITGNLSGSVGSVTGAVGSVTGAVGSVTGAVGSVAGNVDGNVTGSVGSLAAQAKADVNAEVDTALVDIHLDHLLAVASPASFTAGSILEDLLEDNAGTWRFTAASLALGPDSDTTTGLSLAADQSGVTIGTVTSVGTVTGNVDGNVTGSVGSNLELGPAEVNSEVVDALNVDTYAEPGQGAPAATASLVAKIGYLYKAWRNRSNQTATLYQLFADDATTVDQKATVSDDGTTAEKGEIATGP